MAARVGRGTPLSKKKNRSGRLASDPERLKGRGMCTEFYKSLQNWSFWQADTELDVWLWSSSRKSQSGRSCEMGRTPGGLSYAVREGGGLIRVTSVIGPCLMNGGEESPRKRWLRLQDAGQIFERPKKRPCCREMQYQHFADPHKANMPGR